MDDISFKTEISSNYSRRLNVAFFIEQTTGNGGFQDAVWGGVAKAAKKNDVNLFSIAGGSIDNSPYNPYEINRNFIYDLVTKKSIDGIITSCTVKNFITLERFNEFVGRFSGLPLMSIVGPIAGFSDVHVDNRSGMKELIMHMIAQHGHKNLAFITGSQGNPDAEERFNVYKEVLLENGIPFRQELVFNGVFDEASGEKAADYFFKENKFEIDCIIASNDAMAFGALNRAREMGKKCPDDISITGFDDTSEAGAYNPSLTTVKQPFIDMASKALEMLIDKINGKTAVESVSVPAKLITRQSCGCYSKEILQANIETLTGKNVKIRNKHYKISDDIYSKAAEMIDIDQKIIKETIQLFFDEINGGKTGLFLAKLKELFNEIVGLDRDPFVLQNVISLIRREACLAFDNTRKILIAENLISQARVFIGEMSKQIKDFNKILSEKQSRALRDAGLALITTFDFDGLKESLVNQLPRLNIPSFYIYLNNDTEGRESESRLFIGYRDGNIINRNAEFRSHTMPEPDLLPQGRRFTLAVHPFSFKDKKLGYAFFELGPEEGALYDTLQGQISSSLMGSELLFQMQNTEKLLIKRSENIQELVKPMIDSIQKINVMTREKLGVIGNLIDLTKENNEKLKSASLLVVEMGDKIYKMMDVVKVINTISSAVNILALNTSIEAAHAGVHGKGFSVIAQEIRKLSTSVKTNTEQIERLLRDIRMNLENSKKADR
ncbi:MAG TPA: substrate-binding domain-containing protein, partial [Chitinispirillaceae bacterium]|nr:substrate-binding domain-containing protein [Chitinispirillaceae bacterium]